MNLFDEIEEMFEDCEFEDDLDLYQEYGSLIESQNADYNFD